MPAPLDTPKPTFEQTLTVEEMCRALRISRTTGYKMVANNEIKSIKVSGMRRVLVSEVQRLIATGKSE